MRLCKGMEEHTHKAIAFEEEDCPLCVALADWDKRVEGIVRDRDHAEEGERDAEKQAAAWKSIRRGERGRVLRAVSDMYGKEAAMAISATARLLPRDYALPSEDDDLALIVSEG